MARLYRPRYADRKAPSLFYHRKKRSQRVRFRKRYAASKFRKLAVRVFKLVLFAGGGILLLWGGKIGLDFWNNSETLRIEEVRYTGFTPPGLQKFLGTRAGQNILLIRPGKMEREALAAFPELRSLEIDRQWDKTVVITGDVRRPLAFYGPENTRKAVDESGMVFALTIGMNADPDLLRMESIPDDLLRKQTVGLLMELKKTAPGFYSTLRFLKTDRMNSVKFTTDEGVTIYWGEPNPSQAGEKAARIGSVLNRYQPSGSRASLRFVESDRIVLDSHWKSKT